LLQNRTAKHFILYACSTGGPGNFAKQVADGCPGLTVWASGTTNTFKYAILIDPGIDAASYKLVQGSFKVLVEELKAGADMGDFQKKWNVMDDEFRKSIPKYRKAWIDATLGEFADPNCILRPHRK